jgi:hypothetical protein
MPIRYDINHDLDFLVYIFEGECTAKEYFALYHSVYQTDNRRHHGMKILMDFTHAEFNFEVENLREGIQIVAENKLNNQPRDRVAILSNTFTTDILTKTLKVLANDLPMDLEDFNGFYDAAQWLGLAEQMEEAELFWKKFQREK